MKEQIDDQKRVAAWRRLVVPRAARVKNCADCETRRIEGCVAGRKAEGVWLGWRPTAGYERC
jgi:hypothetical protein